MNEQNALITEINNAKINTKTIVDRKRKNSNNMDNTIDPKQTRSNYFAPLSNDDDECDKEILQSFKTHVHNYKDKYTSASTSNNQDKNKPVEKEQQRELNVNTVSNNNKKIPPINICNIETKELISFLKNGLKIKEFKIKEFRNKKSLFLNTMNDYTKVRSYLENMKATFFTFTPKSIKNKTFLLKGLETDTSMDEIFTELCTHECDDLKFVKISQFSTKTSVKNGYKLPIFMVQISPESDINKLKQIRTLVYRIIQWELLRRPEITQCRNCQGFFHSASNCYLPAKCVKCNNSHEKGKCVLKEVQREELYCVLCKKFGHPASYKGCEVYRKLQEKLNNRKQTIIEKKSNNPMYNSYTKQGISYSNIVENHNVQPNLNPNANNSLLQEIKNIMTNLTSQLVNLQQQLQIQTSRIDALFNIIDP